MARIEIRLSGTSGKRTEIAVERLVELDAVAEAVALLLASYGSELRAVLKRVGAITKLIEEFAVVDTTGDSE